MGVLLSRNFSVGHIHFGVHTMLYAAMAVLVGYQAVMFSLFTKVFGNQRGAFARGRRAETSFPFP